VISDERVISTDDPRSDVVFDLVFDVAWPISAALPPSTNDRASTTADASGEVVARGFKRRIWPLVLLRQRRDLSRLRCDVRTGGLVKRADVRRVPAQRALRKPR
jgi:hypothetical protein